MNRSQACVALILAAVINAPTASLASCAKSDLVGTWQFYASYSDNNWVRCKIAINSSGTVTSATCAQATGAGVAFSNGSFRIAAASTCTFTAQFSFNAVLNRVVHATLSRGKTTAVGVGLSQGGNFSYMMDKI
jgi:hypothetical protein